MWILLEKLVNQFVYSFSLKTIVGHCDVLVLKEITHRYQTDYNEETLEEGSSMVIYRAKYYNPTGCQGRHKGDHLSHTKAWTIG